MARMIMIGTFSEKGVRGLMTNDLDREAIVKKTCEAVGVKFVSFDILQGPFDFMAVAEGNAEQGVAMKSAVSLSGDFEQIHLCTSISLDAVRSNVKKIMGTYTPPSGS